MPYLRGDYMSMKVKELIKKLQNFDQEAYIYINSEKNLEDEFLVVRADTDNILLVPTYCYDILANEQEFSFYID